MSTPLWVVYRTSKVFVQVLVNLFLSFGVPTSVVRADFGAADHSRTQGPVKSAGGWPQEMLAELCSNSWLVVSLERRGSTIREGEDTTISSPGRSSKQPLPGMRLHDPLIVRKLAPNSSHLTRGLVKSVPGRGYFRALPSQNGDKYVTSPPPPIVELVSGP